MDRRRTRQSAVAAVASTVVVAIGLVTLTMSGDGRAAASSTETGTHATASTDPWFGVLEPDPLRADTSRAAGLSVAHLPAAWDQLQLEPGAPLDATALTELRAEYRVFEDAGLQVVLDTGLHYAPSWVFELDEATRFVNQFGDTFTGGPGENVPNGVFNDAVRGAQEAFLESLGRALDDLEFIAVRVSGLPYGELRYPEPRYGGNTNSYWAFDAHALAQSPVPDWRPGDPGSTVAQAFLDWYLQSLSNYGRWLTVEHQAAFPTSALHVLMPSWGIRPGEIAEAVEVGLDGTSRGELRETINQGLDWERQVLMLAEIDRVSVSGTWLDAPDQGDDVAYESPIRYLVRLASGSSLDVLGENTMGGSLASMQRSIDRVYELGLVGMLWMNEDLLYSSDEVTISDYASLIRQSDADPPTDPPATVPPTDPPTTDPPTEPPPPAGPPAATVPPRAADPTPSVIDETPGELRPARRLGTSRRPTTVRRLTPTGNHYR